MNRLQRENIIRAREAKRGDRGVRRAPSQIVDGELVLGEILPTKQNVLDLAIEGLVKAATYVPRQILGGGSGQMQPPTPSGVEPVAPTTPTAESKPKTQPKSQTQSETTDFVSPYSWDGVSKPERPNANDYRKTKKGNTNDQYNIDMAQYNKDLKEYKQAETEAANEQKRIDSENLAGTWDRLNSATKGMNAYSNEYKTAIADAWVAEGGQLDNMGKPTGKLNGKFFYQYKVSLNKNPFKN
jgi:hypothetical protein|tara:strand:- start:1474 stop:2196 length:723 start_codon:yes stop_codon:yes gene_type:complete